MGNMRQRKSNKVRRGSKKVGVRKIPYVNPCIWKEVE